MARAVQVVPRENNGPTFVLDKKVREPFKGDTLARVRATCSRSGRRPYEHCRLITREHLRWPQVWKTVGKMMPTDSTHAMTQRMRDGDGFAKIKDSLLQNIEAKADVGRAFPTQCSSLDDDTSGRYRGGSWNGVHVLRKGQPETAGWTILR